MTYLPYNGTSGWSGSETSEQRAVVSDSSGETNKRQQEAIKHLKNSGLNGLTWVELQQVMPLHHGTLSGVLSVLHKEKIISRLSETRNKCKVYVMPENVNERKTEEQGRKKSCPHCGGQL